LRHRFIFTHTFKHILASIIIIEAFIVVLTITRYGVTLECLKAITRFSGRFSLLLFSIIFLAGPDPRNVIIKYLIKPYHAFALAHGIHLLFLLSYVLKADVDLKPIRLTGGFIGYVFIFIMPILYDLRQKEKLSVRPFIRFEIVYYYYVWLIFFMTYLPRVRGLVPNAGGSYWEHVALLGWVSLLLGMKIPMMIKKRRHT
jgi:hypothetical protein